MQTDKLKVLFLFREYESAPNYLIRNQAESLAAKGIEIVYFPLNKGGIKGYLQAISALRICVKAHKPDIIHAHYSLSAYVGAFAFHYPVVTSLMGSDVFTAGKFSKIILKFFCRFVWKRTIVKSQRIANILKDKHAIILPNGVSFKRFFPVDKQQALTFTGFTAKHNIIFVATDHLVFEKNYALAKRAVDQLNNPDVEIHVVSGIKPEDLVFYYNAADVLLLTSISEGSPNVIKEAMACNCPIVSTDVGDVSEVVSDTELCFICRHEKEEIAVALQKILSLGERTNGRSKINHLNEDIIANQLIDIYNNVLKKNDCHN